MNNKRLIRTFGILLLPKLNRVEHKCNRIIAELSELRYTVCPPERNIDALIDKLEDTAEEMLRQSREHRCNIEHGDSSVFTLKVVKDDGFQQ